MALSSTSHSVTYTGNGTTTTPYTIPFSFADSTHIKAAVSEDGVEDEVALAEGEYTVTALSDMSGGTLTTSEAVTDPATIRIYRETPQTQPTTFQLAGPFPSTSAERGLDRLGMQIQELSARVDDFSELTVPEGEFSGACVVRVAANGNATGYTPATNSNAARTTALRAALADATEGDVIKLGAVTFAIATSLASSLPGGISATLELSPKTRLLYASATVAKADAELFIGSERNIENFGAVRSTSEPSASVMAINDLAYKTARAAIRSQAWQFADESYGNAVTVVFPGPGFYYFSEPLRLGSAQRLRGGGGQNTALYFCSNFAPEAGTTGATILSADTGTGVITTSEPHNLSIGQRVQLTITSGLSGLTAATNYYALPGDYPASASDPYKFRLCSVPEVSQGSVVSIATTGTGSVIEMERFGLVVDKPVANGNSNTTHGIFIEGFTIVPCGTGNENFSGVNWRAAQPSGWRDVSVTYCERPLVMYDVTAATVFEHVYLAGHRCQSGSLVYGTDGRAVTGLQIDGSLGICFVNTSIVGHHASGLDAASVPYAAIKVSGSNTISFVHTGIEDCTNGISIRNSFCVRGITLATSGCSVPLAVTALTSQHNGQQFVITTPGTTTFTGLGAANSNFGTVFEYNGTAATGTGYVARKGAVTCAGAFTSGQVYEIQYVGTTDFTLIGATANTVGLKFTASGAGSGTGYAGSSSSLRITGSDSTDNGIDTISTISGMNFHVVDAIDDEINSVVYTEQATLGGVRNGYAQATRSNALVAYGGAKFGGPNSGGTTYSKFSQDGSLTLVGTSGNTVIQAGGVVDTTRATFYLGYNDASAFDFNNGKIVFPEAGGMTIADAGNIAVGTTTGTKIGTATTQRLGFWNATPIVQPASANQAALSLDVDVTGADTVDKAAINTNFTNIQTLVNQLRSDLVAEGLIKGSA